eukprot:superscaffoldBa00007729_g22781
MLSVPTPPSRHLVSNQAQIAFLQGERRGQENLKKDLVRRIKMLEYALKQERYLQEVGYTDTILDVKSQRVRALLGLTGDSGEKPSEKKTEPMVNGTEPSSLKDSGMVSKPDMSDSATVLEAFKFIESAAAEFSDEDEEEDSEGRDKTILDLAAMVRKKQSSTPSSTTSDLSDDPDTEEALKGFDFLASPDELDGSPDRSGEDSGEW